MTANRVITVPDLNLTLVGTDTTQTLQNKSIESLILIDSGDITRKITFSVGNQNSSSNQVFEFPPTDNLNNGGSNNVIVSEKATQTLSSKTLVLPVLKQASDSTNGITLNMSNITGNRTIKFPDSDATLLSTDNVTLDDVNFGGGISANNLTGQTRLQQFFYAGF